MKKKLFIFGLVVCFCFTLTANAMSYEKLNPDGDEVIVSTKYGTSSVEKTEEIRKIIGLVKEFNESALFQDIATLMEELRKLYTNALINEIPIIKNTGG